MPVGDILEARIVCTQAGQTSINVIHYRVQISVAPDPTTTEASAAIDTLMAPLFKAIVSDQALYRGVGVKKIFPLPATSEGFTIVNAGPGTVTGDLLPRQTCGLIKKQTGLAGRAFRGRLYTPFPGEDSSDVQSLPTVAYLAGLTSINTALVLTLAVAGGGGGSWSIQPILWHRSSNTFNVLIPGLIRGGWATQRRRGFFGRPNDPPF
jgi:hypothetical protein